MESDGFVLVRGGARARKVERADDQMSMLNNFDALFSQNKQSLRSYVESVFTLLHSHFGHPHFDLVCYGIGRFSRCPLALRQLAFASLLAERARHTSFSDPAMDEFERRFIRDSLWFEVKSQNDRCLHSVGSRNTVFFMPHCGRPMYNNVLFANWPEQALRRVCLIGNAFSGIVDRFTSDQRATFRFLDATSSQQQGVVTQIDLPEYQAMPAAFNDTSLHFFGAYETMGLDEDPSEPVYDGSDEIVL